MHSGDSANRHWFWDDTSMSTMTCDGDFPESRTGQEIIDCHARIDRSQ